MSSSTSLSTFPSTKVSALTMLYLEKQDLSNITPQELAKKYNEVYTQINDAFKSERKVKPSSISISDLC